MNDHKTTCPFCGFLVCFGTEFMACDEAREVNMVIESIRQRVIREASGHMS